ncbi:MAG: fasciclin domain-containing protein [Trueperaceae bacterium]|nr:fasciclin domain-containing protein [Trueperaceae bacterium]
MRKRLQQFLVVALLVAPFAYAQTVVELAQSQPRFSTLVTAIQEAGLVEALSGEGPFTIFAPTDAAFAELPPTQLNALLNNQEALRDVLLYHVVPGYFPTENIAADLTEFTTLQGSSLPLTGEGVGDTTVTEVDLIADNGVIHVIDGVLTPPAVTVEQAPTPTPTTPQTSVDTSAQEVEDVVRSPSGLIDISRVGRRDAAPTPTTPPTSTERDALVQEGAVEMTGMGEVQSSTAERSIRYPVLPVAGSGVSGSVLISDYGTDQTVVVLSLRGTPQGGDHPAHFHVGDCGEGGSVVIPLENVNGSSGFSVSTVDASYDTIVGGDHAVKVHLSPENIATIVACGEVGLGAN